VNRFFSRFLAAALVALLLGSNAIAQVTSPSPAQMFRVNPQAATATLDYDDIGKDVLITNTGASGAIVLTLPDCDSSISVGSGAYPATISTVGLVVRVQLTVAQDVDLNPIDTDVITNGGTATSAGDAISSAATVGNYVELFCVADNSWVTRASSGTWTDVN
jgi:hypothetical protein